MNSWYVLHVRTGMEDTVCDVLTRKIPDCSTLVPKRKLKELRHGSWTTAVKTLFPGYIFVNTFMDAARYYALAGLPSVIGVLGGGDGPQPVSEEEMRTVFRLSGGGGPPGISEAFARDGRVVVTGGPLAGMEGRIIKIDARRFRAKVNISILGQPRVVELGIHMITKSETPAC